MKNLFIYIHGKGGSAEEANYYKLFFPDSDVVGFDYKSENPWDAKKEFPLFLEKYHQEYGSISVIANSIGAFFTLYSLNANLVDRAYFISPIVNMEKLIGDMMLWANVTEKELAEKREIQTDFGERLSWKYLCYVRDNPIKWSVPTCILYGEKDNLTSIETISDFAGQAGAELTVMRGGEHWFHTDEQMRFLDDWIRKAVEKRGI